MPEPDAKLQLRVDAFYKAALFLKNAIENEGWKQFSSNYLREHARCRFGIKGTNTLSPDILREVKRQYPTIADWIVINQRKSKR